jgi:hypothetical protein
MKIMKIVTILIRFSIGALLIFASMCFFLRLVPETVTTGNFKAFQVGLVASTYLMPLAKGVELICGLAYVVNRYVTLANIVILPVILNILLINYFMTPENLPLALYMAFGNGYMIYHKWENYKSVFTA